MCIGRYMYYKDLHAIHACIYSTRNYIQFTFKNIYISLSLSCLLLNQLKSLDKSKFRIKNITATHHSLWFKICTTIQSHPLVIFKASWKSSNLYHGIHAFHACCSFLHLFYHFQWMFIWWYAHTHAHIRTYIHMRLISTKMRLINQFLGIMMHCRV